MFYISLPVGGVSLSLLWLFLRTKWDRQTKMKDKLKRIDIAGNVLLIASTASVLIALTWAGSQYSWSSHRVVVPLVLGLVGLVGFFCLEGSTWIPAPVMLVRHFLPPTCATWAVGSTSRPEISSCQDDTSGRSDARPVTWTYMRLLLGCFNPFPLLDQVRFRLNLLTHPNKSRKLT